MEIPVNAVNVASFSLLYNDRFYKISETNDEAVISIIDVLDGEEILSTLQNWDDATSKELKSLVFVAQIAYYEKLLSMFEGSDGLFLSDENVKSLSSNKP